MSHTLHRWSFLFMLSLLLSLVIACEESDEASEDAGADAQADAAADAGIDPRYEAIVESLANEMAVFDTPGAALAIIEHGEVTFTAGIGTRDPEGDDPVLPTTLFRIGSVTKMLTATTLLSLVDEGEIDLQKPITEYLPDFAFSMDASWAPSIKVWNLLTHSSGIYDYLEIDAADAYQNDDGLTAYLDGEFENVGFLMAPPGAMYNYSNPNFMLAGYIAEKVSGTPYRQLMAERVFAPIGMDRTVFLADEVLADGDFALGYNNLMLWGPALPAVIDADAYDCPWGRPAGYAWSSVLDLAEFVRFLLHGDPDVLSDGLREDMQEIQMPAGEMLDLTGYGYGLFVSKGAFFGPGEDDFYLLKLVSHGGAIPGYSADMYIVPGMGFGFITLANSDGAYFTETFVEALKALNPMPAKAEPPDLTVDPATYADYAGTYVDRMQYGDMTVTTDGEELTIDIPVFDNMGWTYEPVLEPYAPDNFIFYIQGTGLGLTFLRDDQGKVEYLRTRIFVAEPVEADAGVPDAGMSELEITPAIPARMPFILPENHPAF